MLSVLTPGGSSVSLDRVFSKILVLRPPKIIMIIIEVIIIKRHSSFKYFMPGPNLCLLNFYSPYPLQRRLPLRPRLGSSKGVLNREILLCLNILY